jgi:hypothetical protein
VVNGSPKCGVGQCEHTAEMPPQFSQAVAMASNLAKECNYLKTI